MLVSVPINLSLSYLPENIDNNPWSAGSLESCVKTWSCAVWWFYKRNVSRMCCMEKSRGSEDLVGRKGRVELARCQHIMLEQCWHPVAAAQHMTPMPLQPPHSPPLLSFPPPSAIRQNPRRGDHFQREGIQGMQRLISWNSATLGGEAQPLWKLLSPPPRPLLFIFHSRLLSARRASALWHSRRARTQSGPGRSSTARWWRDVKSR